MRKDDIKNKQALPVAKLPTLTMIALRPLSNIIARNLSPSQIGSILKEFGVEKAIEHPHQAEAALIETFDALRGEKNDQETTELLETLVTLYGSLVDKELREIDGSLIYQTRSILKSVHFSIDFDAKKKRYIISPYEWRVHDIVMRYQGRTADDFIDRERSKLRIADNSATQSLFVFTLMKNGTLARQVPTEGDSPYVMEKNSRRYKVLKALVACKSGGYCKTDDLAESAGCSESDVRSSCEQLKRQFCSHFKGMTMSDIIDSRKGSGYRIHPQIRIIEL